MAGWTSGLHPRDSDGKFKGKAGRRAGRPKVTLIGRGRNLRYSRVPTRGEVASTVLSQAVPGAVVGGVIAGGPGAAIGGGVAALNAGAKVAVLTSRTKRLGGARPNVR